MGIMEAIGLFWVILATGLFTAGVLIAAGWSMWLGLAIAKQRYSMGYDMEHCLREPVDKEPVR